MHSSPKIAVLGASGYSGMELTRLLQRHPRVNAPALFRRAEPVEVCRNSQKSASQKRDQETQPFFSNGIDRDSSAAFSWDALQEQKIDLLFMATPHAVSRQLVPEAIVRGIRVIDLSGAWRLKEKQHRDVYGFKDPDDGRAEDLDRRAVYGLPELNADRVATADLVANPGCYATSIILALAPLLQAGIVDRDRGIISDSKSGVSGAGKEPSARTHFISVADNFSAYSVFEHRHNGEILEQLCLKSAEFIFTPHLLPIPRGILSTIYVYLKAKQLTETIEELYVEFYKNKNFVRISPAFTLPEIRLSTHTNFCDIGFSLASDGRRLIVVSCLDNLLKGAAGQAVQNMNWMYGWDETDGLQ